MLHSHRGTSDSNVFSTRTQKRLRQEMTVDVLEFFGFNKDDVASFDTTMKLIKMHVPPVRLRFL